MKVLTKDQILNFAQKPEGTFVHVYKWSHDQRRKQLNRYFKEGILTRKRIGDIFIFRMK